MLTSCPLGSILPMPYEREFVSRTAKLHYVAAAGIGTF
jgi:hypothetical protein